MNPFAETSTVAFELSNTCPLAWFHKRCPLHNEMISPFRMKEIKHLPGQLVYSALDTLGSYGYDGEINFHQYNEPLIDPRLFEFIRHARRACPGSDIVLLSNGLYLSEQLVKELREAGVEGLWVTLYGSDDDRAAMEEWMQKSIAPLMPADKCNVYHWGNLDDRMENYDRDYLDRPTNCHAPLCTLVITCEGEIALCCQDWRREIGFGSLHDAPLDELLMREEPWGVFNRLRAGVKGYDVCRRCKSAILPGGKT